MARKKKKHDIDFEISFYEGVLKRKGDFVQVLSALGDLYTQKGLHGKGLDLDRRLARLRPEDPYVQYNLACSYSLVKEVDKAYRAMKEAIKQGYDDFTFLEQDSDLDNLLQDPRFQGYYSRLKKKRAQLEKNIVS